MHRTQILLPADLHERAAQQALSLGRSLGDLVREALRQYLDKVPTARGRRAAARGADPVFDLLTSNPYEDPDPDPELSRDVDHHLYGAPRAKRRKRPGQG